MSATPNIEQKLGVLDGTPRRSWYQMFSSKSLVLVVNDRGEALHVSGRMAESAGWKAHLNKLTLFDNPAFGLTREKWEAIKQSAAISAPAIANVHDASGSSSLDLIVTPLRTATSKVGVYLVFFLNPEWENMLGEQVAGMKRNYERTVRMARIGGWEVDFRTFEVVWSDYTRELAEVPANFIPQLETILQFYKEGYSRDLMVKTVDNAKVTGETFEIDVELVSMSGKTRWVHVLGEPQMEHGVCVKLYGCFEDINDRVVAEQKRREAETRYEHLIERISDGILLTNAEGCVTYCSQAASAMLGYKSSQICGKSLLQFVHPEDIGDFQSVSTSLRQHPGVVNSFPAHRLRHANGSYLYVEGRSTNWLDSPGVHGIVSNFRDVTEKREMELAIEKRNEILHQIGELFSHKVRGPLVTLKGLVSLFNHIDRADPFNEVVLRRLQIPANQLDDAISRITTKASELSLLEGLPSNEANSSASLGGNS